MVSSQTTPRSVLRENVAPSAPALNSSIKWGEQRTLIAHVVDLVIDDPRNLANDLTSAVQHASQNLGDGWVRG